MCLPNIYPHIPDIACPVTTGAGKAKGRKSMEELTIFTGITPQEQQAMHVCFRSREMSFDTGEIIMTYTRAPQKIGVVL